MNVWGHPRDEQERRIMESEAIGSMPRMAAALARMTVPPPTRIAHCHTCRVDTILTLLANGWTCRWCDAVTPA